MMLAQDTSHAEFELSHADFEGRRIDAYFAHLNASLPAVSHTSAICVAHMVPNSTHFIPAVQDILPVAAVLPKPNSINQACYEELSARKSLSLHRLDREWTASAEQVIAFFDGLSIPTRRLILVDIGGYFAPALADIVRKYDGEVVGVLEGTENGIQKYEALGEPPVPVLTVARSPLKLPEDHHVGGSVVFSIEAMLRTQAQILQTRTACVIGYGRVGRAVASALRSRGIATVIHDRDPLAMAEAAARGFQVFRRLDTAIGFATLVVCSTGSGGLDKFGLASLRPGTAVATVTSGDDEIDMTALRRDYVKAQVSEDISVYADRDDQDRYFWLLNNGRAANFLHGAVIGPAIQLIEGEKLAAIHRLASGDCSPGFGELDDDTRRWVATIWNEHFLND